MNRRISMGMAIGLICIVASIAICISVTLTRQMFDGKIHDLREREQVYDKIAEIDRLVRQDYYGEIDTDQLMDAMAKGYVAGLGDRYSMYLTAEEYTQQMQDYGGKMVDIGISAIKDVSGYIKIVEVYPDSSAATAGLQKGDLIIQVEDQAVNMENIDLMLSALKGEPGTKVNIVVRRDNEDMAPMEITRRKVEVPTVISRDYDNIGYMLIKEFNSNTPSQFRKALDKHLDSGKEALIFDVRNNPGGMLDSVTEVLDMLLPEGTIVSKTTRDGKTEVIATSDDEEVSLPMVILTNKKTASSAELFAQALKDYNKGRTVGTITYGKGVMQTIYQLSDGSALEITVAKYNPPKSENYDGIGVKPDYEVNMTPEQEKVFYELDETSDPQLKKALELAAATIKTGGFEAVTEPEESTSQEGEEPAGEDASEEEASEEEDQDDK